MFPQSYIIAAMPGWELALVITIIFVLIIIRAFFEAFRGGNSSRSLNQADILLWIAQGFGVGRIPVAPGTFGSVLGVLWFAILLTTRNLWLVLAGTIAVIALAVWLCGVAEQILKQTDPGSVVLDEIAAMPVCYFAWLEILFLKRGSFPALEDFFGPNTWPLTIGVFAAFRFFDVAKPWPVRQSQSLPGGWGVTIDDLLAALYVNLIACAIYFGKLLLPRITNS